MILLRRCLVLAVLLFWLGGLSFYAGVVVPVARKVLRPPWQQAFVTRQVTFSLNVAGLVALVVFAWDVGATRDASRQRRLWRWASWTVLAVSLAALFWLHRQLDAHLDTENFRIVEEAGIAPLHRSYMGIGVFQWVCAVLFAVLTLVAWRGEDRQNETPRSPEARG